MSTVVAPTLDLRLLARNLRLLARADWPIVQAARLEALRQSPDAFLSTYEDEARLSQSDWECTFESSNWMVAQQAGELIGLARTVSDALQPEIRQMQSIWVDERHRGRGVFRTILHELCKAERRLGATGFILWVFEDNHGAQLAYDAVGFKQTGCRQFLPEIDRYEIQLELSIKRSKAR